MLMTMHCMNYIVPAIFAELLYTLQSGDTPLHLAASRGHITCLERLLSTPGIDVSIKNKVSWSIEYYKVL